MVVTVRMSCAAMNGNSHVGVKAGVEVHLVVVFYEIYCKCHRRATLAKLMFIASKSGSDSLAAASTDHCGKDRSSSVIVKLRLTPQAECNTNGESKVPFNRYRGATRKIYRSRKISKLV